MTIIEDNVEGIFSLPLSEMMVKCPPEINSYWSGALLRFNQTDETTEWMSSSTLPPSGNDSLSITDWSVIGSSAIPTPAGILRNHQSAEDMQSLKYYSYGIALPAICVLGILGNVLNLIVLTRPTMRGPAYVYMRGTINIAFLFALYYY